MADRPYRVLVTISRGYTNRAVIRHTLAHYLAHAESLGRRMTLVHGDCRPGSDEIADIWARDMEERGRAIGIEQHPAQNHPTEDFGPWPAAGPKRNAHMVSLGAHGCHAFIARCTKFSCPRPGAHWSHGATGCAQIAEAAGIPVHRYYM